jgi:threonine/homoserine/homoserine lactone efflux protein
MDAALSNGRHGSGSAPRLILNRAFVYNRTRNGAACRPSGLKTKTGDTMLDFSTLGTFVAVVLGLFLIPGPAVLLVLTRTVHGGRKAGIFTGLGVAAGDFVHTLAASVGLSALLMTSALAFNAVKFIGAGYLIYLGVRALREKPADPQMPAQVAAPSPAIRPLSASKAFFQAIPAEVLNPKTALFFLAFLPQFVHPEHGSTFLQFATLGLIFVAMSALYTTLIVLTIRPLGRLVKRLTWLARWQNKIIGVLFISLGLRVATQTR